VNLKREVSLVKFALERNNIIWEIIPHVNNTISKEILVNVM